MTLASQRFRWRLCNGGPAEPLNSLKVDSIKMTGYNILAMTVSSGELGVIVERDDREGSACMKLEHAVIG
jgi:hypothetical protein